MIQNFDITNQISSAVTFSTETLTVDDYKCYIVYDTSTGATTLEDYYSWRATTYTSTGLTDAAGLTISNSNLYPKLSASISDYTLLNPYLFYILTVSEHYVLMNVLDRIDLVRKRLPNPGAVIEDVDGMGTAGSVASVAGGYPKKFAISELMRYIEGALIEINIHPPATNFYWNFTTTEIEKITNPYIKESATGIPYSYIDLLVQGAMIRALVGWGLLEIDLHFITSDAGLQITYDKVGYVQTWMDRLLQEYTRQKELIKWNFANHAGVGVGSLPYAATGIWGSAMNMIEHSGIMPLTSMLGFNIRSNIPM